MRKIKLGEHYKKTSAPWTVWEVVEETIDRGGVRHFRIRNLKEPTTMKLISEWALANERFYLLVEGP